MTMQSQTHPNDERLAALAGADPDATGDSALSGHVSSCDRCSGVVDDLRGLRAALAELPDLMPSRPLRLIPPAPSTADRAGGWVRRVIAPVMTAGAALALVGLVGTGLPALSEMADSPTALEAPAADEGAEKGTDGSTATLETDAAQEAAGDEPAETFQTFDFGDADTAEDAPLGPAAETAEPKPRIAYGERMTGDDPESETAESAGDEMPLPAARSPWPMVLFGGVAVMVGALLLRWILAPRAA